ncbi:MAG: thioredoxin-dependent thiol peroxidase [Sandaracinaceae bacterium]
MLEEGTKAPGFSLPSSEGGEVSLEELRGRWVVLYFYPRDNTPGCTTEAIDFRDAKDDFASRDAVILGVSKDSLASHEKFKAKHDLNFHLLADPETTVHAAYGAWGEKKMYGKTSMGTIRSTFLIDPSGVVRKAFPKVRVKGHVAKVLETLDELRAG